MSDESFAYNDNYYKTGKFRTPSRKELLREQALKDFYGKARGEAEIIRKRKKATSVEKQIEKIVDNLSVERNVTFQQIVIKWQDIVGKEIAKYTEVCSLSGNCLTIAVNHSSALHAYRSMSKQILAKVKKHFKGITFLKFIPQGRYI